jgi:hypothetical protein
MAKAPSGQDISTWDGKGTVWFKIYAEKTVSSTGQLSWASMNKGTVSTTIPKNLPSGDYLLRIEHIALHQASSLGGAQFYISCAQVHVTGGGNGSPAPLVSFPGVYTASDPGIKVNIYSAVSASLLMVVMGLILVVDKSVYSSWSCSLAGLNGNRKMECRLWISMLGLITWGEVVGVL